MHCPFSGCDHDDHVNLFPHGIIGWEDLALLDGMADDTVQRFDRVGGVDGFSYVVRIGVEDVEIMPGCARIC